MIVEYLCKEGKVTEEEVKEKIDALDKNEDGMVSREEIKEVMQQIVNTDVLHEHLEE